MNVLDRFDGYVKYFARRFQTLPDITLSYEDLVQEGRLVILECLAKYDRSIDCSIETFCYACLRNWFVCRARKINRASGVMQMADPDAMTNNSHGEYGSTDPEHNLMVAQALSRLRTICKPIADIILEDIGDDFYLILKDEVKQRSIRNKWSVISGKVRLTKKIIRECFGLTKKDLSEIAQILKLYV